MAIFDWPHAGRIADAACRLGPRPVLLAAWHRAPWGGRALARRRLRTPATLVPAAPLLPETPPPAPPGLPPAHGQAVLRAAVAAGLPGEAGWHGPFPREAEALSLDLFGPGDIRPVWERNRWAALPLMAQAARLDPAGGHLARAEALLADWLAANRPFQGPNWACGQEAALRALHLGLAIALLGGAPGPAARAVLALHAQRIAAAPAYALAQDNNHAVSEAAGLLACGLLLGDGGTARRGAARLEAAVLRLVAPCGAFAQASTGYHRLLLDVLAVTEWLARRHGMPGAGTAGLRTPGLGTVGLGTLGLGTLGLGPAARDRAAAATRWLARLACPETGALPRIGHQDGSAFADLSLAGPADARGSIARAARLFAGRPAGAAADPGCAWLGLDPPAAPPWPAEARWTSAGFAGWQAGRARAVLRTGVPLRFRPGQADLLHLDLWDGPRALLRDGGTGAYNPPPEQAWWHAHFTGTAAHNTVAFDAADQMPRAGRFLFARWPRTGALPGGEGAWIRDHRGNRHERWVAASADGRRWTVEDRVAGPFRALALRWRLDPAEAWRLTPTGVAAAPARIEVVADAPLTLALEQGWESPAYGEVRPAPVLVARARAPLAWLRTTVLLGGRHS